jgi:plastocyanin
VAAGSIACDDGDGGSPPATPAATAETFAPAGPVTLNVIGGKADGAMDIEMFMPADVHIREGDRIEWALQGFEGHTVTFATPEKFTDLFNDYLQPDPADAEQVIFNPELAFRAGGDTVSGDGEYVNSGFMGVPVEQTFTLTFSKRGVYEYLCVVHPFTMRGTVSVDAPDAQVESPASVAERGQADLDRFLDVGRRELADAQAMQRTVPGPDGTNVHRVATGLTTNFGQVATFVQPVLDTKAGDTVIFENDDRNFHNVVFKGAMQDPPPGVTILSDPEGRGINYALTKASAIAVDPPPEGFDDKTFLSSGSMGVTMPRLTWRLTFETPGTYIYNCTIHVLAGMAGVINVSPP